MGTPVHTSILPTLKYVRLSGLSRPRGADGRRHFNRNLLGDLVKTSTAINSNYHFLYEAMIERVYSNPGAQSDTLGAAAGGSSLGDCLLAPKTVGGVARRRAWSRLSTPGIARDTIRTFGESYRQPAPGAPENTTRKATEAEVQQAVASAALSPAAAAARDRVLARTAVQFRKNGTAIRRALEILHGKLPR